MKRLVVLALVLGLAGAAFGDMWIAPMGTGTFASAPDPNGRVISFSNGIVFDTRQGEPSLPAGYRSIGASDMYLVQFSGPVQERWVDELSKAGAVVYSYIPNYSFTVRMNEKALAKVKAMTSVAWIGTYQPAYKVVESRLFGASGQGSVVMMLYPDADIETAASKVQNLGGVLKEKTVSYIAKIIRADLDLSKVVDLANLPEVMALHSWSGEPQFLNNNDQWTCQSGWQAVAPPDTSLTYRPIWKRGIRGQGQITSEHDSGISFNVGSGSCFHRDPAVPITAAGEFPTHRKVVAYKIYGTNVFGDTPSCSYHGTHTTCTTCGNDTIANGTGPDTRDGIAKDARINFTDIADANCGLQVTTDLTTLYDTVVSVHNPLCGPVHQHSGSWGWGNSSGTYLTQEATTDAWHWRNKLVLPIFSAGNSGGARTIGDPALAKNVCTVGATGDGVNSNAIASYSSRGPAQDNRIKPTVSAPGGVSGSGTEVMSANGAVACGVQALQGTSMACPSVNGSLTLVRQYFRDGWYPTGRKRSADTLLPSAALLRAMAVCSGDSGVSGYVPPEFNAGFGRLNLSNVLSFDTLGTTARKLAVVDNRSGLASGTYVQYRVNVNDSTLPLRAALAWVDTAAAVNANPCIVNNFSLELTNPYGVTYRGNKMSGWRSTANPTGWDSVNVEETARIVNPRRGDWLIRVYAQNAPQGSRVWFGLVLTGGLAPGISGVGGEPVAQGAKVSRFLLGRAVPNPTTGETRIDYALPVNGQVSLGIYNTTGQLVRELMKGSVLAGHWAVTWNGCDDSGQKVPGGVYFYKLVVEGAQPFTAAKRVVILK
jgi:hypothetical protein